MLLGNNCNDDKFGVAIFSFKPCRRSVFLHYSNDNHSFEPDTLITKHFLSFPSMVVTLNYRLRPTYTGRLENKKDFVVEGFYLGCFNDKQLTFDTKIKQLPLPNIFPAKLFVCLGRNIFADSFEQLAKNVFNSFWQTKFKFDDLQYGDFYPEIAPPSSHALMYEKYLNLINNWECETKNNPKWVPNDFIEFGTYKDFLEKTASWIDPIELFQERNANASSYTS